MSGQRVLGATLVWLVVVASVSALVWVVISRAGDDLVASDQPLMTTASGTVVVPPTTPVRPSRTPSKSPSRTPSATPSNQPSPTPSPSGAGATSGSPSTTPPTASPIPPKEQPSNVATETRQTWQGQAGSLVVSCGAAGIRLVSAQPADGFRADVHREDDLIDVEFEGREDRSGTHIQVVARCVGGAPSFSTHSEQDD